MCVLLPFQGWSALLQEQLQSGVNELPAIASALRALAALPATTVTTGPTVAGVSVTNLFGTQLPRAFAALSVLGDHLEPVAEGARVVVPPSFTDGELVCGTVTKIRAAHGSGVKKADRESSVWLCS